MKSTENKKRDGVRLHYQVIAQEKEIPDAGLVITYGILATDEQGKEVCIPDVSTYRRIVDEMAERFSREQVSLVHIRDIVEDFLGIGV